jgi:hypothetical protein
MFAGQHPSTPVSHLGAEPSLPIDSFVGVPLETAYLDPNLIVLFFLLGFCLLYALIVAAETLSSATGTDADRKDRPSKQ